MTARPEQKQTLTRGIDLNHKAVFRSKLQAMQGKKRFRKNNNQPEKQQSAIHSPISLYRYPQLQGKGRPPAVSFSSGKVVF